MDRMESIEHADALRRAERQLREDIALGLVPDTETPRYNHTPKKGVKRSGHYGASARRVRDRAYGAACLPPNSAAAEDLANGRVPQSYLSNHRGLVFVTRERRQTSQPSVAATATIPETARFTTGHDFNN